MSEKNSVDPNQSSRVLWRLHCLHRAVCLTTSDSSTGCTVPPNTTSDAYGIKHFMFFFSTCSTKIMR